MQQAPLDPTALDAARLAAERYQLLVTNLPNSAVMLLDHDLRFVLADGPELARSGTTKSALEGRFLIDAMGPAFTALVEPNLRSALAGHRFQDELPFGDQSYLYTYEPLRDRDGHVLYAMVVAQNVTALRLAEQSARQHEARIRELVGNLPGVVFAVGPDRRYRFASGEGLQPLRLRPGEVDGRLVDEVFPDRPDVLAYIARAFAGERVTVDVAVGDATWETRYTPVRGPDGAVVEVLGIAFDVTEKRRAEATSLQSQKLEAVGRLAGGIAHDFNNMLGVMITAAEELRGALRHDANLLEAADLIAGAACRAAELTRQLLAFARNSPVAAGPVVVDEVVAEMLVLLGRSVDRRVEVVSRLAAHGAIAVVDAAQLQAALLNLAINARDAMPGGGVLTVSTDIVTLQQAAADAQGSTIAPGTYVRIAVSDTGVGIAPEHLGRVFDPFFTTKEVGRGTGLGLSVVYGTARAHGGGVLVDSTVGKGTTFEWFLPVAADHAPADEPADGSVVPGQGLVLLVDDEPLVRRMAQRIVEGLGFHALLASNGAEGVELFRAHHDRLVMVICDVVMPGLSGPDAVRLMRAIDPDVPLALCSGYAWEQMDSHEDGTPEVMAKPFTRDTLAGLLARRARRQG